MANSLAHIASNIFMKHFEKWAIDSAQYKPSLWLRYVKDTFVIWPHGRDRLQNFFNLLNSLRSSIQFTMETESDILVIRKVMALATEVYRKPTHTSRYLQFKSNHFPHVKRGIVQSLHNRASIIYA
jgi:hypothetical protein